jgi:hypothetical protein
MKSKAARQPIVGACVLIAALNTARSGERPSRPPPIGQHMGQGVTGKGMAHLVGIAKTGVVAKPKIILTPTINATTMPRPECPTFEIAAG